MVVVTVRREFACGGQDGLMSKFHVEFGTKAEAWEYVKGLADNQAIGVTKAAWFVTDVRVEDDKTWNDCLILTTTGLRDITQKKNWTTYRKSGHSFG